MTRELTPSSVEKWGLFELRLHGPASGNPYMDVTLQAEFTYLHRTVTVDGFYDGNGNYCVRFMPDHEGEWNVHTRSNVPELDGICASFDCLPPSPGNRGPVRVYDADRFVYADGTPYRPFGTTCYAWIYQPEELQKRTLTTLKAAPFNKLRMCVFPKWYSFNAIEPEHFPFSGGRDTGFDYKRFNPAFFDALEHRIIELQQMGIEADLILFHPYDKGHWGFDQMDAETDDFYLRYVIVRLAAYRNVWWSLANEYDFMKHKTMQDWDRFFRIVQEHDPYGHLRSIHNGTGMYDYTSIKLYDQTKPWVSHVSLQHWDLTQMRVWRKQFQKPVVVDECGYEGDLPQRWGNLPGELMTLRFWDGFARGGFVGHGETFVHPEDEIWWAKGGELYGESPARISFLRSILEDAPFEAEALERIRDVPTIGVEGRYYLQYFGIHRPAFRMLELPEGQSYYAEIIDTWDMTITALEGSYSGVCRIDLPCKQYIAIRLRRLEADSSASQTVSSGLKLSDEGEVVIESAKRK